MSMSEDAAPQAGNLREPTSGTKKQSPNKIFLISYPKIVFLYPTFLAALVAGIYMLVAKNEPSPDTHFLSLIFLIIFAVNLIVLSFDFPRTTSLTLFFFCVAVAIGLWTLFRFINPELLPVVYEILRTLNPLANSTFYFFLAGLLGLIYIGVAISVRFDYWEVRPNELLHHHGFLSDLERFSAPHLRIDKEINDVFEYMLLRAGRLILHPSNERRAIILENVFFINRKEEQITQMLGALQVQIRQDGSR